jgi:hypothetical protein
MRVFKALRGARLTEEGTYITLAKSMRRLSRVAGGLSPFFLCKDRLIHPCYKLSEREGGGIGRRTGFRFQRRKACGFESRLSHHFYFKEI